MAAAYEILAAPGKVIRTLHEEAARSLKQKRLHFFTREGMNLWTQLRYAVSAQMLKGQKWDQKNLIVGKFVERVKMLVFQRK